MLKLLFACALATTTLLAQGADAKLLPRMKPLPAGEIHTLSCPPQQPRCAEGQFQPRRVQIEAFEMAETELTFAQWDACVADGGCSNPPSDWAYKNRPVHPPCVVGRPCQHPFDQGWGRGQRPVIHVSWEDVQDYLKWLNAKTGSNYRLPTSEEWEYAALAGTSTRYPWGQKLGKNNANCAECGSRWDDRQTAQVASFKPNPWGLHDLIGNVAEWVSNCIPLDSNGSPGCRAYLYRGGAWSYPSVAMDPRLIRNHQGEYRDLMLGFRLARTPNGLKP